MKSSPAHSDTLLISTTTFNDADDYQASLRDWALDCRQLSPGTATLFNHTVVTKDISYLRFSQSKAKEDTGLALNPGLSFFLLDRAKGPVVLLGKSAPIDTLMCLPEGSDVYAVLPDETSGYTVTISLDLLEQGARTLGKKTLFPSIGKLFPLPSYYAGYLRKSLHMLYELTSGHDRGPSLKSMMINDVLVNSLVPLLVTAIHGDFGPDDDFQSAQEVRHLHTIVNLITDNLDAPPSLPEIASTVNVSSRQVQYIFKKHMGITPQHYSKAQRLHALRQQLKTREIKRGTIKTAAQQLGFWHMGQLARDYRHHFGYSPKETPKRRTSTKRRGEEYIKKPGGS